jgi:hypothetical protein
MKNKKKWRNKGDGQARILVNGHSADFENIEQTFCHLLGYINFSYSPFRTIRENIRKITEIFIEHCEDKRTELQGQARAKVTKAITNAEKLRDYWLTIEDINVLKTKFYDKLLSIEGLGPLRGFTAVTVYGDKLYGNPEKMLIKDMRGKL